MADWTEELSDEQKNNIMDLIVTTVKEIRYQMDQDILFTQQIWERKGFLKSRRTRKAFEAWERSFQSCQLVIVCGKKTTTAIMKGEMFNDSLSNGNAIKR